MDKPNTSSAFSRTSPNVQFTHPSSHRPQSPSQTQNMSLTRASPLHLSHHSTSSSALPGASTPNTGIFKRQSHMTPPPTSSSPLYTDKRYFKMNDIFKLQITKYSINLSIRAVRWIKYIHQQHNRHLSHLLSKQLHNHEAVHRHLFCDIHNQCHYRWLVKVQFHRQCYCSPIHHTRRIDIHRIYFTRRVHSTRRIHIIHMDHLSNIWNLQQLVLAWIRPSFHIIQVKQHDTKIHHHIPTNNLQTFYKWKTKWNRQHQNLLKGIYLLALSIFKIRKKKKLNIWIVLAAAQIQRAHRFRVNIINILIHLIQHLEKVQFHYHLVKVIWKHYERMHIQLAAVAFGKYLFISFHTMSKRSHF